MCQNQNAEINCQNYYILIIYSIWHIATIMLLLCLVTWLDLDFGRFVVENHRERRRVGHREPLWGRSIAKESGQEDPRSTESFDFFTQDFKKRVS